MPHSTAGETERGCVSLWAMDGRVAVDRWATARGAVTISSSSHQIVWVPHAHLSTGGKVTGVAYIHFRSEKAILTQPKT